MLNTIATTLIPVGFVLFHGCWSVRRNFFGVTDLVKLEAEKSTRMTQREECVP